jgi:exodeoxyribonuclease VII large subunit
MAGPAKPGSDRSTPGDDAWSVAQLCAKIGAALETGLPRRVRVLGEISNFNDRTHWYFALKDDDAVVSCVMFASAARRSDVRPEHGQQVVATGRVEHFAKQGRTQLYVERLEPVGVGALEARYQRLVEELRGLGYFDAERKRTLPMMPRRVVVVTSRTGAALQDVLDTMRRRCPGVGVLVADVRVQGDGAATEVARTVRALNDHRMTLGIDVLVITRGGGSLEDLWAFNERPVADAVLASELPVVAAIGHETDTTIAELVADVRCATPTQAGMAVTPDRAALAEQTDRQKARLLTCVRGLVRRGREGVDGAARRGVFARAAAVLLDVRRREVDRRARDIRWGVARSIDDRRLRVERLAGRLTAHRPEAVYARRRSRLERASEQLSRLVRHRLRSHAIDAAQQTLERRIERRLRAGVSRLDALERELVLVSPASVLSRGYSITTRADDGAVVRSTTDASAGTTLETRLADGIVRSRVDAGSADACPAPGPSRLPERPTLPPRQRAKGRRKDHRGQMGLF